jgi:hypothetical protein
MTSRVISPVVRPPTVAIAVPSTRELHWGLSARLPRWRAFDGLRFPMGISRTGSMTNEPARSRPL